MIEYKCCNGHDVCNTMYPSKECPYCEPVSVKKCANFKKYKALRPPRCNGGNPCEACINKWEEQSHIRQRMREMEKYG